MATLARYLPGWLDEHRWGFVFRRGPFWEAIARALQPIADLGKLSGLGFNFSVVASFHEQNLLATKKHVGGWSWPRFDGTAAAQKHQSGNPEPCPGIGASAAQLWTLGCFPTRWGRLSPQSAERIRGVCGKKCLRGGALCAVQAERGAGSNCVEGYSFIVGALATQFCGIGGRAVDAVHSCLRWLPVQVRPAQ